jgi:hypothetical protein
MLGSGSYVDGELDGTIGERLLDDRMTCLASFDLCSLHRIRLEQAIQFSRIAPPAVVVIEFDVSAGELKDGGKGPARKFDGVASSGAAKKLDRRLNRVGEAEPLASGMQSRCIFHLSFDLDDV